MLEQTMTTDQTVSATVYGCLVPVIHTLYFDASSRAKSRDDLRLLEIYLDRLELAFHHPSPRDAAHGVLRRGFLRGGDDHAHGYEGRARGHREPDVEGLVSR